ncbi:PREDICTED: phosphatidylinositol-glycan biosynthesis class F protein [Dinoponera quadriceps]|uniref:Phosphatidylinositol-glycan biosynthesis class F protein n=1 Tax=Dinoponera quadriceps TaxID=609295 RepID=A0A6P3WSC2_DINQU|nr:PREDICTED: phosphatidylinositol-glycan biosynthesis class F protein [Dinoponera quadriceps]
MNVGRKTEQRLLLSYCSFTCIYFPGILILAKFNDNLYNVGKYKFLPVLLILVFAEVIKLLFPMVQTEAPTIVRIEQRASPKAKKSWSRSLRELFKFSLAAFALSVVYYIAIILFGAPVLTDHEETTMLVITLLTLTLVPTSLHLGVDNALDVLMGAYSQKGNILVDALRINIQATILGTWLGATVIPLDWDRPWQVWPVPCVIGALLGYLVAHFITLIRTLPALKLHRKVHR